MIEQRHSMTLPGDEMLKNGFLKALGVVIATSILAACGGGSGYGGSGSGGTTGSGSTTGGTTPTGVPGVLTLTPVNATSSSVTVGNSIVLIATLTDTAGFPLANSTLKFSTTGGALATNPPSYAATASGSTNSSGKVTVFLQAPSETGTATVTVSEQTTAISGSTNVTFTAAGASNIALTIAPTKVATGASASINAQVTDKSGNPVSGQIVNFGFYTPQGGPSGNASGGQFAATQAVTDANGRATTTYQAGPTPGSDALQVSAAGGALSQYADLTVSVGASQIGSVALSLGAGSVVADGATTTAVTATVTDSKNNPLPGVTVTLTTSVGILQSAQIATATTASGATLAVTTDVNGVGQVFQVSPKLAGNGTITASSGGYSASQPIVFVAGKVTTVTAGASPVTIAPNGTSTITVQLSDVNGNVVGNHTAQLSVQSGQFSGGGLVLTGTTNAQGVLSASYVAPPAIGPVTITATAEPEGGSAYGTVQITVSSSAVSVTGVMISAGPNSIPANGASTSTVRATVTGATGSLSNIPVTFTTTAGAFTGGSSTTSASTDSSGNAIVTLTSPLSSVPVTATVTAATGGVSSSVPVAFTVSVPATVSVALSPPTVAINNTTTVNATVLDANNNPVSGAIVNFNVLPNNSNGALSKSSAQTNSSGVATTTYTAGGNVSSNSVQDTIQASTGGVSNSAMLTVTDTVQVGTITLISSAPQLLSSASIPAQGITLTAVVKDVNNNVVPNIVVQFTATRDASSPCGTGGAIQVLNGGLTNASGQAQAILYTGGDTTNQAIDIIAKASTASAKLTVVETGTHLSINGPSAVGLNANPPANYTITLADAGNNPISGQTLTASSALGNTITPATGSTYQTSSNGQITINYASTISGSDILTAVPAGCASSVSQATQSISVAAQTLSFLAPMVNTQIPFSIAPDLSVSAAISTAGAGYVVGDVLTVQGGTYNTRAQLTVTAVNSSGGITAVTVNNAGDYTTLPTSPASVSGGTGNAAMFAISQNVTVLLVNGSGPISGATIAFSTTRGTLSPQTAVTNASGLAAVAINQTSSVGSSGGAVITATCAVGCGQQISASVGVQFNAVTPSTVSLQANPTTVAINGTSVITATVRDINNNPVANQSVNFTLTDDSGGGLLQSVATTNTSGQAVVNYRGGATTGSQFGVRITGTVSGIASGSPTYSILSAIVANGGTSGTYAVGDILTLQGGTFTSPAQFKVTSVVNGAINSVTVSQSGVYTVLPSNYASVTGGGGAGATFSLTAIANGTTALTVGGQALRIVLGTGNTVNALNSTQYQEPYSILVTDAAGNPPPAGSVVTLTTNAISYQKGSETYKTALGVWTPNYAVTCASDPGCTSTGSFGCFNEDTNLNGILDSGEDYNGNGSLDPGNVTSVPTSVTLDGNGTGQFNITYAKDRANWVQVFITASIYVNGNQGFISQSFVLPGESSDFTNQAVSPPGQYSPYGQASVCVNPN